MWYLKPSEESQPTKGKSQPTWSKREPNRRAPTQAGGGLCIYVRDTLSLYTELDKSISSVTENVEQLWITIKCPNVKKKIIGVIYRPPWGNINACITDIRLSLDTVYNFTSDIIICGDFNINYNLRHTDSFQLLKGTNTHHNGHMGQNILN